MTTVGNLVAVALLAAGCASSTSPESATTAAVVGVVLSAPSCPVEQAGSPCPPRPVSDALVEALQAGVVVATAHTDARGQFTMRVPVGRYVVRATNVGGYASTAQRQVTVRDHGPALVIRLVVDSGIR